MTFWNRGGSLLVVKADRKSPRRETELISKFARIVRGTENLEKRSTNQHDSLSPAADRTPIVRKGGPA